MYTYKILLIFIVTLILFSTGKAQDCVVLLESLKGKYDGPCKNGKAEGIGRAEGTDVYEGEFRSGLPDGAGKYTWKNGNWYEGKWFKGKKEGNGKMMYKLVGRDSLVNGFWKKDAYAGKYEKPYIIHYKTVHITHLSCIKQNNTLNQLDITLDSETGGTPEAIGTSQMTSKPVITDITITEGNFERKEVNDSYGKKILYTLQEVTFPFRATFTIGNDSVDLEFLEAGRWTVELKMAY